MRMRASGERVRAGIPTLRLESTHFFAHLPFPLSPSQLPYAFAQLGIGGALILSAFICGLSWYCGQVLIRCHDVVVRDTLRRNLTYTDLATYCFGPSAGYVVYGLLVFCSSEYRGAQRLRTSRRTRQGN